MSDASATHPIPVRVDWDKTVAISKTRATMMHMVHPISRKGTPIHAKALEAIKYLDAEYVRYMNWHVYPRLSIAALHPPTPDSTSWDFSAIDAELVPYLQATKGREPVVSFAAIPPWMFKNDKSVVYPDDPHESILFRSIHGKELLDPTGEQVAEYFARIASWYTRGGFTDENGQYHRSGYQYELPWWEVLNEVDSDFTPEQYTKLSDAVIAAVRKVSPNTKFVGLSLAFGRPEYFEYWLNPENHRPGTPLDMMAYHFYAIPAADLLKYDPAMSSKIDSWQYSFFEQAAAFIEKVKYVEFIRKRLSPTTRVNLNELGTYVPGEFDAAATDLHIPHAYWNLSAGVFAYLFAELAKLGIDILAQSLLATGPGMAPSNTMMNWTTGKPNARFHMLKLLNDHFAPGDRLVETQIDVDGAFNFFPHIAAQAFVTPRGKKLLLINKRIYPVEVPVASAGRIVRMDVVDEKTGDDPARSEQVRGGTLHLGPFAVAVASIE